MRGRAEMEAVQLSKPPGGDGSSPEAGALAARFRLRHGASGRHGSGPGSRLPWFSADPCSGAWWPTAPREVPPRPCPGPRAAAAGCAIRTLCCEHLSDMGFINV